MEMRVFLIGDYVLSKVCLEQTEINGKNKIVEKKVARIYHSPSVPVCLSSILF